MIWVRSALFNVWFFGTTFVMGAVGAAMRFIAPDRALAIARIWSTTVLAGARVLCGITIRVTGLETIPPGAALMASQHQSAFDTMIWTALLPRVAYVYKAELERIPLFGPMLVAAGQIPLDRGATMSSVRGLLRATSAAKADGRQIVIFPEGTRVGYGVDAPIRGGFTLIASRTGLPIYPVATNSGRLWGRRAFRKFPGCIRIHIGEPIPSTLPGPELIATLKQRWRDAGLGDDAVDNSVDSAANMLTSERVNTSFAEAKPPRNADNR